MPTGVLAFELTFLQGYQKKSMYNIGHNIELTAKSHAYIFLSCLQKKSRKGENICLYLHLWVTQIHSCSKLALLTVLAE